MISLLSILALTFTLEPAMVKQGQVALIKISDAPSDLSVQMGNQKVALWDCEGAKRCGVIGVPLETPVGKITAEMRSGRELQKLALGVERGDFKVNKLKVPAKITKPNAKERAQIAQDKLDIEAAYKMGEKDPLWAERFELPTGGIITSLFGNQRVYNGILQSVHLGVDLRANETTPIHVSNTGKVVLAKNLFMAGNLVLVDHGSGVYSSYAHLSRIDVQVGQSLKKGEQIGMAGATGRVTAPHLHWSTKVNGIAVDPHALIKVLSPRT
ncbi:MAG: M23 family metallopeptidase [Myxococcota bacterium]